MQKELQVITILNPVNFTLMEFIFKEIIKSKDECYRYQHQCNYTPLLQVLELEISPCASKQNARENQPYRSHGRSPHQQKTQVMFQVSGLLAKSFPLSGLTAEPPCLSGKFYSIPRTLPHPLCTPNWEELDATPSAVPQCSTDLIRAPFPPIIRLSQKRDRIFYACRLLPTVGAQEICSEYVRT